MSQELLNELISKSEELNIEKKLQLMRYLSSHLQRNDNSTPKPRRKWRDIQGKAMADSTCSLMVSATARPMKKARTRGSLIGITRRSTELVWTN
ncbi:MAG: hypothetical protein F6K35_13060 [Okeania sp. SIO2H7]|nr:hypothetical protein [Okeania sp. SIO2H7]